MQKIILFFLFLFFVGFCYAKKVINIADYGIINGQDVTPIIRNILEGNKENFKVVFPKDTYHFYPTEAFGKYHAITNHDNIYRYFSFPIIGMSDVEIDGGGSDFIFHGLITPFLVEKSKSVKISNFSVDWEQPFFLQAEVLSSNEKDKSMDIRVHPMAEPLFEGNRLGFITNGHHLPFLGESMVFDPKTRAVAYKAGDYVLNTTTSRSTFDRQLDDNTFRIQWDSKITPPPAGLFYISKGPNRFNRYCPGIHLIDSKDILLEQVVIHHAGGMGVIGEKTEDIHINELKVILREGTDRIVTTTADATHFCNCKGKLLIENCIFENMLDDACNIHGTYLRVHGKKNDNTILVRIGHFQQFDYHFAQEGDSICFVDKQTMLPIGYGNVKEVQLINDQIYEMTFKESLPGILKEGDGVENITWYPETIFRNNIIRNNRARGVLVSSRNKTLIQNNSFSSMMSAILFEGDLSFWHEAGAVKQVEIKDNLFLDNVYGGRKVAVIHINPRMEKVVPDHPYESKIVIEGNEFRTFDNAILSALSVDGLVFRGNKIIETYTYPKIFPESPTIKITSCTNTVIHSNTYSGREPARIEVDNFSRNSLLIDKIQKGFGYSY